MNTTSSTDYNAQNVTNYPNNNTYFLVWNFKDNVDPAKIKSVFQRVCALVINLNNSALDHFSDSKASCVMGIGYEAWQQLQLPQPLSKEFKKIPGNKREQTYGSKHKRRCAFSYPG